MSSSIRTRAETERARQAPAEVTIYDWAMRDRPLGSSLAVTLAAGLCWLAVWATGTGAVGAVVGILLAVTLWRTLLPVRYELGPSGIDRSILGWRRRIAWSAIRHCELRSDGVVLYPLAAEDAAPLSGVYLHWGDKRDAVLAQLDYYLLGRTRLALGSSLKAATR